jgi:hypothetical protein
MSLTERFSLLPLCDYRVVPVTYLPSDGQRSFHLATSSQVAN